MTKASVLREKAEMFERRAESATDPTSEQHYREMAAEYRGLLVEHLSVRSRGPVKRPNQGALAPRSVHLLDGPLAPLE